MFEIHEIKKWVVMLIEVVDTKELKGHYEAIF